MSTTKTNRHRGFTIVELLIVIVVIAILASISIVAYNGIQQRARDTQRAQDMKTIAKALEMYYADNGRFPTSNCGTAGVPACPASKKVNGAWATTSDGSWNVLEAALVPKYISAVPKDPQASTSTPAAISGGYNYDYVYWVGGSCEPAQNQGYRINYRTEITPLKRELIGTCVDPNGVPAVYAGSSQYVVAKN